MTRVRLNDDFRQLYPNDPLNGYFLLGGLSEWLRENVVEPKEAAHSVDLSDINRPVYIVFQDDAKEKAFKEAFPAAVGSDQSDPGKS